jgi:S1-C subfamily serine protease
MSQDMDITDKFSWHIDPGLTVVSNSTDLIKVYNGNAPKGGSKIDYLPVTLEMNYKGPIQILLIHENISDPTEYTYEVYSKNRKGEKVQTWYEDNIYYGTYIEMYGEDGSIVEDLTWVYVSPDNDAGVNIGNRGWQPFDVDDMAHYPAILIELNEDNTLSINGDEGRLYNHVTGIKSISLMVGTAANITIENFAVVKPDVSSTAQRRSGIRAGDAWTGNGTGFFIDRRGYIATSYHVIEDAEDIEIEFNRNGRRQTHKAEVIQTSRQNDLAILQIRDKAFRPLSFIPYNLRTNIIDVGTNVFTLGYPMALSVMGDEIKFTDGKISSKTGVFGDATIYQISVPLQPGNSGGPLFDFNGNLTGIVSSGLNKELGVENVNYAVKTSYLKNIIDILPFTLHLPKDKSIAGRPLTEQIKILQNYVVLVKIK